MARLNIAIVGSGVAGCISALWLYQASYKEMDVKMTMYHDPTISIEPVGQGTTPGILKLLFVTLGQTWYNNVVKATKKTGIKYENWGSSDIFHPFIFGDTIACHWNPNYLSKAVRESGLFEVVEKKIENPEEELDADIIFDCRGRPNNYDDYDQLVSPVNSALLARKEYDPSLDCTKAVATPNGWTFIIPNVDSVSYGYLYNDAITTKEDAESDFINLFDVEPNNSIPFKNYVAKSIWKGERTVLNGNMFSFIEPLEATSALMYARIAEIVWFDGLLKENTMENRNNVDNQIRDEIMKTQTFLLWHYQNGSKYDTPFWHYAKSLPFERYGNFDEFIEKARDWNCISDIKRGKSPSYSQWPISSFYNWLQTI